MKKKNRYAKFSKENDGKFMREPSSPAKDAVDIQKENLERAEEINTAYSRRLYDENVSKATENLTKSPFEGEGVSSPGLGETLFKTSSAEILREKRFDLSRQSKRYVQKNREKDVFSSGASRPADPLSVPDFAQGTTKEISEGGKDVFSSSSVSEVSTAYDKNRKIQQKFSKEFQKSQNPEHTGKRQYHLPEEQEFQIGSKSKLSAKNFEKNIRKELSAKEKKLSGTAQSKGYIQKNIGFEKEKQHLYAVALGKKASAKAEAEEKEFMHSSIRRFSTGKTLDGKTSSSIQKLKTQSLLGAKKELSPEELAKKRLLAQKNLQKKKYFRLLRENILKEEDEKRIRNLTVQWINRSPILTRAVAFFAFKKFNTTLKKFAKFAGFCTLALMLFAGIYLLAFAGILGWTGSVSASAYVGTDWDIAQINDYFTKKERHLQSYYFNDIKQKYLAMMGRTDSDGFRVVGVDVRLPVLNGREDLKHNEHAMNAYFNAKYFTTPKEIKLEKVKAELDEIFREAYKWEWWQEKTIWYEELEVIRPVTDSNGYTTYTISYEEMEVDRTKEIKGYINVKRPVSEILDERIRLANLLVKIPKGMDEKYAKETVKAMDLYEPAQQYKIYRGENSKIPLKKDYLEKVIKSSKLNTDLGKKPNHGNLMCLAPPVSNGSYLRDLLGKDFKTDVSNIVAFGYAYTPQQFKPTYNDHIVVKNAAGKTLYAPANGFVESYDKDSGKLVFKIGTNAKVVYQPVELSEKITDFSKMIDKDTPIGQATFALKVKTLLRLTDAEVKKERKMYTVGHVTEDEDFAEVNPLYYMEHLETKTSVEAEENGVFLERPTVTPGWISKAVHMGKIQALPDERIQLPIEMDNKLTNYLYKRMTGRRRIGAATLEKEIKQKKALKKAEQDKIIENGKKVLERMKKAGVDISKTMRLRENGEYQVRFTTDYLEKHGQAKIKGDLVYFHGSDLPPFPLNYHSKVNSACPGHCTAYAFDRAASLGVKLPEISMGDGGQWVDSLARQGYQTGIVPQAGAVCSMGIGKYGHVVMVEHAEKLSDGRYKMVISESNYINASGEYEGSYILSVREIEVDKDGIYTDKWGNKGQAEFAYILNGNGKN